MYACQSTKTFAVRWPPEAPRYLVTFGPKHNWTLESKLGWWCSCPDNEIRRHPSGKMLPHKANPAWDIKRCKHIAMVRTIYCGWQQAVDGGAPARIGDTLVCPHCGLPVVEERQPLPG